MYILNYLDRNNLAATKLTNIQESLIHSETKLESCISILYAGYSRFPDPLSPGETGDSRSRDTGAVQHDPRQAEMACHVHLLGEGGLGCHIGC
ncbi:hypothetical protein BDW62DRAFT_185572 [Aspergillus aurantiobrunneus]